MKGKKIFNQINKLKQVNKNIKVINDIFLKQKQ